MLHFERIFSLFLTTYWFPDVTNDMSESALGWLYIKSILICHDGCWGIGLYLMTNNLFIVDVTGKGKQVFINPEITEHFGAIHQWRHF